MDKRIQIFQKMKLTLTSPSLCIYPSLTSPKENQLLWFTEKFTKLTSEYLFIVNVIYAFNMLKVLTQ